MPQDTMNLVLVITAMLKEKDSLIYTTDRKIQEIDDGVKALRKINTVCEECGGSGKKLRSRTYAKDDRPDPDNPRDWRKCPACRGDGRARYKND